MIPLLKRCEERLTRVRSLCSLTRSASMSASRCSISIRSTLTPFAFPAGSSRTKSPSLKPHRRGAVSPLSTIGSIGTRNSENSYNSYRLRTVSRHAGTYVRYNCSFVFCRVSQILSLAVALLRFAARRAVQLVQPRLETRLLTRPQHLRAHVGRVRLGIYVPTYYSAVVVSKVLAD